MSLQKIKSNLEPYLFAQITDIPIKAYNTNVYTLNSLPINIENESLFIEPRIIPIEQPLSLMSTNEKYLTRAFYQIAIFQKLNEGTGDTLGLEARLNTLFRNKIIGTDKVTCRDSSVLSPFEDGEWSITTYRVVSELWSV